MAASEVETARASFARQQWAESFRAFSAAEGSSPLAPEDQECLAVAAYLIGAETDSGEAWKRAYHGFLERGDPRGAIRCAFWLAFGLVNRGEHAQAQGWFARAQRVLDDSNVDCVERGYLLLPAALQVMGQRKWPDAQAIFIELADLAQRFGDPDLTTFGHLGHGQCLIGLGQTQEGIAELDEVMVSVTSDEVSPITAGIVYCAVIEACHDIFDLGRAQEWTDALTRWCESQPDLAPYRGQCLVHRSQLMQLRGNWEEALAEAQKARERFLYPPGQPAIGMAYYQLGELNRLRGKLAEAEDAYVQANAHGRDPEPGLALLRLAQGRVDAAAASSRRALMEATDRSMRVRLLAAHVEIMLASGDVDEASSAAEELAALAREMETPWLGAVAAHARGATLLAAGSFAPALEELRRSLKEWRAIDAPYEMARTRHLLGLVCRCLKDEDSAVMELQRARADLERLGAKFDAGRVQQDLAATGAKTGSAEGLTPREQEVLQLLATGSTNRVIAEQLYISEKTVARHVSNIFMKLDVGSRAAATAYAYEHSLV
ncbi:MAG: LuxR C-terminal-related transcriptional regulator [Actinomycetota bacterium]